MTFAGTLLLGILEGILIGVGFTLLALLQRATRPNVAVLGRVPGERVYRDVARAPEADADADAETVPGLVIVRWYGELFFANASHLREELTGLVEASEEPRAVLLDAAAITSIDVTAAEMLAKLFGELEEHDLTVLSARTHGPLRDMVASAELDDLITPDHQFRSVREGVEYYRSHLGRG